NAALNKSYLWYKIRTFTLTANMQATQANNLEAQVFAEYLLRIGDGTKLTIGNNLIRLPDKIIIHP
ncbi:13438_t:CDS:1, partial [Gigaspora margarita]